MFWIFKKKYIHNCLKYGKNLYLLKSLTSMKPTWRYRFLLFHSHNPKQKRNHRMTSSRANTRSTQSQICVKYRGITIFDNRNKNVNTGDLKRLNFFPPQIMLILSSISPTLYVFCLQLHAWLESCDQDGPFGTRISGSLIVSPVLWVLSLRNTLSVTHSDTASYVFTSYDFANSRHYITLKLHHINISTYVSLWHPESIKFSHVF